MAELLTEEELRGTPFEPHLTNRFICTIDYIESHLIYAVSPIEFTEGVDHYGWVSIYHSITPDPMISLQKLEQRSKSIGDIVIRQFGPAGDITSRIVLHECTYSSHGFENSLSYVDTPTFNSIRLEFRYRNAEYTSTIITPTVMKRKN